MMHGRKNIKLILCVSLRMNKFDRHSKFPPTVFFLLNLRRKQSESVYARDLSPIGVVLNSLSPALKCNSFVTSVLLSSIPNVATGFCYVINYVLYLFLTKCLLSSFQASTVHCYDQSLLLAD